MLFRSLKEAFQQLWDYNSAAWAGKFLDEWCRQVMRSHIEPMKKIARSLRLHRELILNYFRAQKLISSGVVEGLDNKAKVTMRKSYGFRTHRVLELALYHSLGKLPEPQSVAVGTGITARPPHRSVRAELPHTAPALDAGACRHRWRPPHRPWRWIREIRLWVRHVRAHARFSLAPALPSITSAALPSMSFALCSATS